MVFIVGRRWQGHGRGGGHDGESLGDGQLLRLAASEGGGGGLGATASGRGIPVEG